MPFALMSDNTSIFTRPHGGNIFEAARSAGCRPEQIIDFSASINALGYPDGLGQVLVRNIWKTRHYPDPGSSELVKCAAAHFNIQPEMVAAANGATELLDVVPRVVQCRKAVIPAPAYAGYAESALKNDLPIKYVLSAGKSGRIFPDIEEINSYISPQSLVFLGRPNNPTGHLPDCGKLKSLIADNRQAFFVIDESFLDFTFERTLALSDLPNLLIVYSLTKFYALPGLRLGLCMGRPDLIKRLSGYISPWSVNSLAQEAGLFCLKDSVFQQKTRESTAALKTGFTQKLKHVSWLDVAGGEANFLLCRINDGRFSALELAGRLMREKILIRPAHDFQGLDNSWFRLAVKSSQDNAFLCSCLEEAGSGSELSPRYISSKGKKALMIQGVCSGAGKSLVTAGLCRILRQDGVDVAPFKSQNMSLNSYVTANGLEMGRAQVVQARACGLEPDARMNPVLLKPNSDTGSQVIVLGKPVANMDVNAYINFKKELFTWVKSVYDHLASEHQVMILEGAGSPAEINLKKHDMVNMNMARHAKAAVLLVGDIDRGGVFASFAGTLELLLDWEKDMVAGLLINKFRGQKDLLQSAMDYITACTNRNFYGIIPFVHNLGLPEEDSVSFKNQKRRSSLTRPDQINIGVIDLPHISNFTDIDPLYPEPDVNLSVIREKAEFDFTLDVLILPGSKNVASDLGALKTAGLYEQILDFARRPGKEVLGICGGLQMLGLTISDSQGLESDVGRSPGLGLLPLKTGIMAEKTLRQVDTSWTEEQVVPVRGYEIHHGRTRICGEVIQPVKADNGQLLAVGHPALAVWGTYIHGIFDSDPFRRFWLDRARKRKGLKPLEHIQTCYDIDAALDRLAGVMRENIDLRAVYRILGI
ncbi:MAG: cobyric acid synthase [Desulfonatronovibrio sp.]